MRRAAWCSAACCPACAASAWAGAAWRPGRRFLARTLRPHVEVALLPEGRRPPGQLFRVTDDMLPDLSVALGVHKDYDWERRGAICTENMVVRDY